jgi:hypothetical protein
VVLRLNGVTFHLRTWVYPDGDMMGVAGSTIQELDVEEPLEPSFNGFTFSY